MNETKVLEWIDIAAPPDEVYALVVDVHKRIQLSPLWGIAEVVSVCSDYPKPGSTYLTRLRETGEELETQVTRIEPGYKLGYSTLASGEPKTLWTVQKSAMGSRITYEESFKIAGQDADQLADEVRNVIRDWMTNIKRYCELRQGGAKRFVRWLLDRYYLRMRQDQRKAVQTVLFLHAIGMISFVMAAIAVGFASLI